MKKLSFVVVAGCILSFVCLGATECLGVGGDAGEFGTAANWDPAIVPNTADAVAVFTNTATVTSSKDFVELHVRGGNLTLKRTGRFWLTKGNANNEVVVFVAEGSTADLSTTESNLTYGYKNLTFVKDGGGVLKVARELGHDYDTPPSSYHFKAFDIRGGTLHMEANYGGLKTVDGYIHIRSGAKFEQKNYNQFSGAPLVEIDEGGTLDLGKVASTVRAVIGKGSVVNATAGLTMRLKDGPHAYGGVFPFGAKIVLAPTEYVAGTTKLVLEDPTALSQAVPTVSGEGFALSDVLTFKAGTGVITVANESARGLKDEDGNALALLMEKAANYVHAAAGDDDWSDITLIAHGNVTEKSAGTWTIGSITMDSGKTFAVDAEATGKEIHLKAGTMSNVTFTTKANYDYCFDGVDLRTPSALLGVSDRIYHQTAGNVYVGGGLNSGSSTTSIHATNDVYYYISGGTLVSVASGYYNIGTGLEASGDAYVILSNGTYSGSNPHVLQHSEYGYTLRVRGNAVVEAEDLGLYYYKAAAATARVELVENGVLAVRGILGATGAGRPASSSYACFFSFDGGTLRSLTDGDQQMPYKKNGYSELADKDMHVTIGAGGATFDVPRENGATGLEFCRDLHTGVAEGKDGGFTKTGLGYLTIDGTGDEITGPVTVKEGVVNSAKTGNPFGTGSVILNRAVLSANSSKAQAIAAGEGSTVTLAASGSICKNASSTDSLVIGPADATSTSLVRQNHAVLGLMLSKNISQDFVHDLSSYPIRVNGGIGDVPVFTWATSSELSYAKWGKNRGLKWFRPVSAAADGTLYETVPVATNEIPTESTAGLVRLMKSTTFNLTANATIGSLELYGGINESYGGFQIAKDKTLTVGGGAGTIGTIVLNNNHISESYVTGAALIGGAGAIDFGAAEGLVVANDTYYEGTAVRRPAVLACHLTGTGGVTFAVPYVFDATVNHSSPDMHAVSVQNSNDYAGGTWIEGLSVGVRKRDSLGVGTVTVAGDAIAGGTLLFEEDFEGGAFTNALVVSGEGHCFSSKLWGERAAVRVEHDVRLAGGVTLTADTKMVVESGSTLALDSAVTGTGKLTVKGDGTVSIGAAVSCSGGIDYQTAAVEIRPADAGSLTIPAAQVPAGATIVVDPTGAADGCGVVTVDGDLDLGTVSVRFAEKQRLYKGTRFTFLKTTGTLTGSLDPSLLPSDKWHFEYADDSVTAVYDRPGMLLLVR